MGARFHIRHISLLGDLSDETSGRAPASETLGTSLMSLPYGGI